MNGAMMLSPFAKRRVALGVGLAGIGLFVGFLWYAFAGMKVLDLSGGSTYTATFADGLNVVPQSSEVRVNGLTVGRVSSVQLQGTKALVTFKLDPGVTVRDDASAQLMLKSLLGEKYVLLNPGSKTQPVLQGSEIKNTAMGADVTQLSAGGVDSQKLYKGLGRESVFKGLNLAANLTPNVTAQAKEQLESLRKQTDTMLANQNDIYSTLDQLETVTSGLVESQSKIGALIDSTRVVKARLAQTKKKVLAAWVRTDTSAKLLIDIVKQNKQGILDAVARARVAQRNGQESLKIVQSGGTLAAGLYGLGPLFDKDNREPGPNPTAKFPKVQLPSEAELRQLEDK